MYGPGASLRGTLTHSPRRAEVHHGNRRSRHRSCKADLPAPRRGLLRPCRASIEGLTELLLRNRAHIELQNGCHGSMHDCPSLGEVFAVDRTEVRQISPQYAVPFVKTNKNDRNDAEAVVEAASRPTMRFMPEIGRATGHPGGTLHARFSTAPPNRADQPDTWPARRAPRSNYPLRGSKMNQALAEVLLLASMVVNATLLIFIAGVLRHVMNDMDAATFKDFVGSLVRHSTKSPFMIIALNVPLIGAIPYYYFYGFGNRWISAGLALWLAGGLISKLVKLPIYKSIRAAERDDEVHLREQRRRLNTGNLLQAALNSLAAAMMIVSWFK